MGDEMEAQINISSYIWSRIIELCAFAFLWELNCCFIYYYLHTCANQVIEQFWDGSLFTFLSLLEIEFSLMTVTLTNNVIVYH